ncbi:hypothetical protein EV356DRAFT_528666 [Viridothelium virens]|uniref:NAD(P)-binding protein n=1 Tax=Viridothelium virens TaxID=1048519 RepID=A0A6A6HLT3_VIRVR|nr:hypothetical protein EV356DRAFT_528666 [Viridothelium virens]
MARIFSSPAPPGTCSILAEFISRTSGPLKAANVSAAVRSEGQVQSLSNLGVNIVQVDVSNELAVKEAVVSNEIDIVIHTASAVDSHIVSALIKALGQRRESSGQENYFIHSSVATIFSAEGGWPFGEVRDTDPIFEKEKEIEAAHPVRKTGIVVTELAKAQGVTSFNIPVPQVYGRGSGEWRKLSVSIPAYIRTSIKHKVVYKFDKDGSPHSVHISDLVAFYVLLTEKILQKEPIPSGEKGYYFPISHRTHWWAVMERLAKALHARGLVMEPKPEVWPSDDIAAEYLGFQRRHIRAIGTSSGQLVPVNAYRLGWQPKWDEETFLASLDDEIQAVQELDTVKSTVFDNPASNE